MWKTKGCDRCGGDMYKAPSEDGDVLSCLQCGREIPLGPPRPKMTHEEIRALFADEPVPSRAA